MTVSIPLVALVGVGVYVAWRFMGLRVWQAILCLVFGFLLAATTAGPKSTTSLPASSNGSPSHELSARPEEVVPYAKHSPACQYRSSGGQNQERPCAPYRRWLRIGHARAYHIRRDIADALNDTVALSAEITRLPAELQDTRLDRANLLAAIRATLAAHADGEPDPMWYLRDALDAPSAPSCGLAEASMTTYRRRCAGRPARRDGADSSR